MSTTPHLAVIELEIHDRDWIMPYEQAIESILNEHGAKVLARTNRYERIEGERANSSAIAVVEFPSREAFSAFYDDPRYRPHLEARLAGSAAEFILLPLEDLFAAPA